MVTGLAQRVEALLNGGVRPEHTESDRMRIRLSNLVACSDIATAVVMSPLIGWLSEPLWGGILFGCFLPNFLPLWLNPRGYYRLARNTSIVATSLWLGGLAYVLGPDIHLEMGLLVTLSGSLVLLPPQERYRMVLLALSPLSLVSVLVARQVMPTEGLVSAGYTPYLFGLVLLATMANVADRILILMREAERRSRLLGESHQEAVRASEAKSRFLAHMSHELRTPLAGVIGLTDLLQATKLSPDQRDLLQHTQSSAHHLMGLLNGVLDLAKIEAGAMRLESAPFEVNNTIQEALALVRPRAQEAGLRLTLHASLPSPLWRQGDALRLKQILVNLLGNAIKFTPAGEVSLIATWEASSDRLALEIADTGIGMTPEQLAVVFQPFQQAEDSTARRFGGTGLGLSITQQLLSLAGGTLRCESTPGQGTRFSLSLPLLPGAPPPRSAQDSPDLTLPIGLSILVAEDNTVNQMVIRRMLERLGQTVVLADDGEQALTLAQAPGQCWDLILMDMQMPIRDGLSATRVLRDRGYTGPICGLTANALPDDHDRCRAAGMDEVLTKPVDLPTLAQLIARWALRRAAPSRPPARPSASPR